MKKTLTIIAAVALAIYLNPQAIKAQTCATCPGNTVTGASASALGLNNTVSGTKSTAIGNDNIISSGFGFIAGAQSKINSSSTNSYIIGGFNTIFTGGQESYIFGSGSEALASRVMLIGHRLKSGSTNQIIIGAGPVGGFLTNNKMHSLAVGFKSTVPTFFVGESPSSIRTGKVSIGNTTDPQAKLHIRADAAEDASLLLEATGTNKISSFIMAGGQAYLGTASNNHSLSFVTGGTNTRMFINAANGNIGIGSEEPVARLQVKDGDIFVEDINRGIIMKSPDGNCWRGVLNNSGQLEFTLLPDCNMVTGSSVKQDVNPGVVVRPNPASGFLMVDISAAGEHRFTAYKLLDSAGKEVISGKIEQLSTRIEMGSVKNGIYFLHLSGENSFWSEKVIIRQ
jgi:hypothetical protein